MLHIRNLRLITFPLLLLIFAVVDRPTVMAQESNSGRLVATTDSPDRLIAAAGSPAEKLEASLSIWKKARRKCRGDYSYTVRLQSFAGFGNETEIVVRNHKVVGRKYRTFSQRALLPGEANPGGKSWSETGDDLDSHKEGAATKTLDQIYVEAGKVLSGERAQNERLYVRFDKKGLLLSCFTVDTRIADDAPKKGVSVSRVTLGRKVQNQNDEKVLSGSQWQAVPGFLGSTTPTADS